MTARLKSNATTGFVEAAVVFLLVGVGYALLLSDIAVDDVQRYINELSANRFFWDLGHVWAEPIGLLAYRAVGRWFGITGTLELVNVVSIALGLAVFFDTMRSLGHGRLRSALAVLFVALSFNILSLGPTAHIKLPVFPAMALSMRYAVLWEASPDHATAGRLALAAGLWLGIGATLLVSVLPTAAFLALFAFVRTRQTTRNSATAARQSGLTMLGVALGGSTLMLAAYATALATDTTGASNLLAFVLGGIQEKQALHVGLASWREIPFRFAFSLVNNFVFLPSLGAMGRAWLWGMLPAATPHWPTLLGQIALASISLVSLAGVFYVAIRSWADERQGLLLAFAYVLGAAAFSLYYNLNDPEHWFQFTLPIAFIAFHARRRWLDVLVWAVWLPLMAIANLSLYGVPKATFALEAREQDLRGQLGAGGLYVGYAAYPGEPDSSLLSLNGIEAFKLDLELMGAAEGDVDQTLQRLDRRIDAAFARGGRVLVFRALTAGDWRGPVMLVSLAGLTRERLRAHLERSFRVVGPTQVAGFDAYELLPATPR